MRNLRFARLLGPGERVICRNTLFVGIKKRSSDPLLVIAIDKVATLVERLITLVRVLLHLTVQVRATPDVYRVFCWQAGLVLIFGDLGLGFVARLFVGILVRVKLRALVGSKGEKFIAENVHALEIFGTLLTLEFQVLRG